MEIVLPQPKTGFWKELLLTFISGASAALVEQGFGIVRDKMKPKLGKMPRIVVIDHEPNEGCDCFACQLAFAEEDSAESGE